MTRAGGWVLLPGTHKHTSTGGEQEGREDKGSLARPTTCPQTLGGCVTNINGSVGTTSWNSLASHILKQATKTTLRRLSMRTSVTKNVQRWRRTA